MRIEKFTPYIFVLLCSSVLIGSMVIPRLLTSGWLWTQLDNHRILTVNTVYDWKHAVGSWDWVKQYRIRWVSPGYVKIDLESKKAVAKTDQHQFIDPNGRPFENKHSAFDVPDVYFNQAEYTEVVKWISGLKDLGLEPASFYQGESDTAKIEIKGGGALVLDGLRFKGQKKRLAQIEKALRAQKTCYLVADQFASCQP